MALIDTHCHLNFKSFSEDYLEVAKRSQEKGLSNIIIVGSDASTSKKALKIAKEINSSIGQIFAYCAVGIHPTYFDREGFSDIEDLVKDDLVVAIGETGLDNYHDDTHESEQTVLFLKHIELAKKVQKPIIIHSRKAEQKVINLLKTIDDIPGVVFHCFSGDHNEAREIVEMGMKLSFTGNITYGNKKLKKVIERTDLESIMVETDAPYIVPEPLRSEGIKRCEPYFVEETSKKIAIVKNVELTEVIENTTKNAIDFFKLN